VGALTNFPPPLGEGMALTFPPPLAGEGRVGARGTTKSIELTTAAMQDQTRRGMAIYQLMIAKLASLPERTLWLPTGAGRPALRPVP
jgi:hypothetical protein